MTTETTDAHRRILGTVSDYYTEKVRDHGPTPQGADWSSEESQELRFAQLLRICDGLPGPLSLLDYGCGYGALVPFLDRVRPGTTYRGHDISAAMLEAARREHEDPPRVEFIDDSHLLEPADVVVASGIFNVRREIEPGDWERYVLDIVDRLAGLSRRGFAFNVLTSYSDPERMRADLYYAEPETLFEYVKRHYSRNVALLHDYGLYEFTILARLG